MAISATIGILVARHLGPKDFGRMSYVLAFIGLFAAIVPLGLPSVLVREMVRDKSAQARLLAIGATMQAVAAALVYLIIVFVVFAIDPHDPTLLMLIALYGLTVLAKPAEAYQYWFQVEVKASFTVRLNMAVLAAASIANLVAIFTDAGLLVFVAIQAIMTMSNSIGIAIVFQRVTQQSLHLIWDWATARHLMRQAWPLIVSAVGLVIYLKIDQVMLGRLAGDYEVGVYSAALRLSEVWYSVPMILMSTFFPALIQTHETDKVRFRKRVEALLDLFNGISIMIALVISFASVWLVDLLYGAAYAASGPVLALHIWAAVFIFMGTLTGNWYLLNGIQYWNMGRNFLGAGLNVGLNLWAIPLWGAWGAALATLISYIAANYVADIIPVRARPLFWQKTASLFLWPRIVFRARTRLPLLKSG